MALRLGSLTPSKLYLGSTEVTTAYLGATEVYSSALPWTPSELGASLALWLDADDASTITLNGSTVSQWSDKSGNGRHATQASASAQPTYEASGFAGKPSVTWIDNLNRMDTPTFTAQSFYFVTRYSDGTQATWLYSFQGLLGGNHFPIGLIGRVAPTDDYWLNSGNTFSNIRRDGGSEADTNTSNVTALPFPNGIIGASAVSATTPPSGWVIGNDRLFAGRGWTGPMAEIIATPTLLSDTDRQKLEGYLAWKWGLEANLPADHPYKNTPPTV